MSSSSRSLLQRYKRLKSIEEALFEALVERVDDADVDAFAAQFRVAERGEALYDHSDYGALLDLALYDASREDGSVVGRFVRETGASSVGDESAVLRAMGSAHKTLLRLRTLEPGIGWRVEDVLFGGELLLVDLPLSKERPSGEVVLLTRVLVFDGFATATYTGHLDFDPSAALLLGAGLRGESPEPIAVRYAVGPKRTALEVDLTHMALSSADSVKAALTRRFSATS